MKKFVPFAALLILVLASIAFSQTPPSTPAPAASPAPKPGMTRAQIRARLISNEKKLWEAWKNKDAKPFRAHLSADSVMVGDSGVGGKEEIIKDITSAPCEVTSYELSDFKLTFVNSGVVVMTYKGAAEGTCGGQPIPTTWASSLWVNRGGKWQAVSHQETPVKP